MIKSIFEKRPAELLTIIAFIFYIYGCTWLKEIPDNYILAQYFFSYQLLGFVKRGLIATIGNSLGFSAVAQYLIVAFGSGILLSVFSVRYFWLKLAKIEFYQRIIIVLSIVICPAFLSHCGYGFGRFDAVILMLLFLALSEDRAYKIFLISAVAILIHEVFIIAFGLLLYDHLVRLNKAKTIKYDIAFVVFPLAVLIIVILGGGYKPGLAALNIKLMNSGYLWSSHLINGDLDAPYAVLTSGISENIKYTFSSYSTYYKSIINKLILVIGLFWYIAYAGFLFYFSKINNIKMTEIQIISALCPLLLACIGIDFFRWLSFSIIILLIVLVQNIKDKEIKSLTGVRGFLSLNLLSMVFPIGAVGFSPALSFFGKLISQ